MHDRGETSLIRSVLTSSPAILTVSALTGGLLVAVPAPSTGAAQGRSGAVVRSDPGPVSPEVRETQIPPVSGLTAARSGLAAERTDDNGESRLAAHVRLGDVADFTMLGVTWSAGAGEDLTARVRTLSSAGWSSWTDLHVDHDEGPASGDESAARPGTGALWVDHAHGVEVAVYTETGRAPRDLQVSTIDPGESSYDGSVTSSAGTTTSTETSEQTTGSFPPMPSIITRRQWGADPSLGDQCWDPRYGTTFKNVFVHHTVSSNDYSRAEAPGIVRGIYAYHTQSRGWCDIGYNFLVDRYGKIYEGRRGGILKPVRGAHAGDYNTNSTGISLIGNFESASPTRRMKTALVSLIAWRMGRAYHGAYGKAFIYDRKFKRISGHRDAMATACPGQRVYDWLPRLRERVANRLGTFDTRIEEKWRDTGGVRGWLGPVWIGEQSGYGGHWTAFHGGRVYLSAAGIVTLRKGGILATYVRAGEVAGRLGYPIRRIRATREGDGSFAVFETGRAWWSSRTGAKPISKGPLLQRYRQLGASGGRLGFPTSTNFITRTGGRLNLEHGRLVYDKRTRKVTVTYR